MLSVFIRIASVSTHNIQFHDKNKKISLNIFLELAEGTQKCVRISHGKRDIGVRAIEVRLY